jgi:hypothetical protein
LSSAVSHIHQQYTPNSQICSQTYTLADDTSVIIYHPGKNRFQNGIYDAFAKLNKWFKANTIGS